MCAHIVTASKYHGHLARTQLLYAVVRDRLPVAIARPYSLTQSVLVVGQSFGLDMKTAVVTGNAEQILDVAREAASIVAAASVVEEAAPHEQRDMAEQMLGACGKSLPASIQLVLQKLSK